MASMWKGLLRLGLVEIPVTLFASTEQPTRQLRLLHAKCSTAIHQRSYCPECKAIVPAEEVSREYESEDDPFLTTPDEEQGAREQTSDESLEIVRFVDRTRIPPACYGASHYLAPQGHGGREGFALLWKVMKDSGRAAIARGFIGDRVRHFLVEPYKEALAVYELRRPVEVRSLEAIQALRGLHDHPVDEKLLGLAETLLEDLTGDFEPEALRGGHGEVLHELVPAKAEDMGPPRAEPRDLMTALRDSVARIERRAAAQDRKPGPRGRSGGAEPPQPRGAGPVH